MISKDSIGDIVSASVDKHIAENEAISAQSLKEILTDCLFDCFNDLDFSDEIKHSIEMSIRRMHR